MLKLTNSVVRAMTLTFAASALPCGLLAQSVWRGRANLACGETRPLMRSAERATRRSGNLRRH